MLPHQWKHLPGALKRRPVPAACAYGADRRSGQLRRRGADRHARDDRRGRAPAPRSDLLRPRRRCALSRRSTRSRKNGRSAPPRAGPRHRTACRRDRCSSTAGTRTGPTSPGFGIDGRASLTDDHAERASAHRGAPREVSAVRRPRPRVATADPDRDRARVGVGATSAIEEDRVPHRSEAVGRAHRLVVAAGVEQRHDVALGDRRPSGSPRRTRRSPR